MPDQQEDISTIKFTTPAAVIARAASTGVSEDELLTLAKERAPRPETFSEFPPVFFPAEISSNRFDSYFTRMMPSSLQNYAREAAAGVSFQDSHETGQLGMGRSLTGRFIGAQGDGVARTICDFFVIEGLADTNSFLTKYRTGIATDVSIGFYGGRFICSICNGDMMDWRECWHYAGNWYTVEEKIDDKTTLERRVQATADVEDAHLAEVSAVFKGSTPGAVILKAQRACAAGQLEPEVARILERRYRSLGLELPVIGRIVPGHTPEEKQQTEDDKETRTVTIEEQLAEEKRQRAADQTRFADSIRAALKIGGLKEEGELPELLSRMGQLGDLAQAGQSYRTDLIEKAIEAGVRAEGNEFKREEQEAFLRSAPILTIKGLTASWNRVADKLFPGGNAVDETRDNKEPKTEKTTRKAPAAAHSTRY